MVAYTALLEHMKRVFNLVDGFESSFGLELLATVHWLAVNGATSLDEVVKETYAWGHHKKQFSKRQIEIALRRLATQKWITPIEGLII